ncbi:unnamed protein product [Peronospora belbahrii]|uniref:Uncharacterized protein n=1 Tax=Peronospora belbahrii TaxID=622444 RepID=A0ABN8D2Z7_9STRA|nr:unnamed protein product [Peronospora belbahrii]
MIPRSSSMASSCILHLDDFSSVGKATDKARTLHDRNEKQHKGNTHQDVADCNVSKVQRQLPNDCKPTLYGIIANPSKL